MGYIFKGYKISFINITLLLIILWGHSLSADAMTKEVSLIKSLFLSLHRPSKVTLYTELHPVKFLDIFEFASLNIICLYQLTDYYLSFKSCSTLKFHCQLDNLMHYTKAYHSVKAPFYHCIGLHKRYYRDRNIQSFFSICMSLHF